jgi:hypothetical protein
MTDNRPLISWQLDSYKLMPWSSIKFKRIDQDSVFKAINMEDVYCTQWTEQKLPAQGSHVMLTLSARVITVAGIRHENNWEG